MSTNLRSSAKEKFDPTQWVSQAEAAKMRGVTRQAIARLVAKGRFTTLSVGGRRLISRSDVEKFTRKPPGPSPKARRNVRD